MTKRQLSIDIETYSSTSLKDGLHKYVNAPDFEIILFAWAFDNDDVKCVSDMNDVPDEVLNALNDKDVEKTAWNAAFEIACIEIQFNIKLKKAQWRCTMVLATMLGLPAALDAAGRAMKLETEKDLEGKALIRFFCVPCKPTKTNGMRRRNLPTDDMAKWYDFTNYCIQDVVQERLIKNSLKFYRASDTEHQVWVLDQEINNRGVATDLELAVAALDISELHKKACLNEAVEITELDNLTTVKGKQIKDWLESSIGAPIESFNKKEMPKLMKRMSNDAAKRILLLREEVSKTSIKKYKKLLTDVSKDGRLRGWAQYYGGARTGRWAGRGVQPHNLPRQSDKTFGDKLVHLDMARKLAKKRDLESLDLLWKSPLDVLSQLIRTAFVAGKGKKLLASDFSAIEARVTAWLAGETWRLKVFNSHGKIYEASASAMFKVALDQVDKELRQRGKVSELALGFGGGPNALVRMGAMDMDFMIKFVETVEAQWKKLTKGTGIGPLVIQMNADKDLVFLNYEEYRDYRCLKELAKLVRMWRQASPKIVTYWKEVEQCAVEAVQNPGSEVYHEKGVSFKVWKDILWIKLPSGRYLTYQKPKLVPGKFEGTWQVTYLGVDQKINKWIRMTTYGGKITENIVQAVARDLLAWAMLRLKAQGFDIVLHVHDEVVLEIDEKFADESEEAVNKIMAERPPWAPGLPLGAESLVSTYYRKE